MIRAMTALTKLRMNVDEFAVDHPGRFELFRGEVYAMSPETVGNAKVKGAVYGALLAAGGKRQRKPTRGCPITSYFDVRDAVLPSVSCASLSYASAAPVMVALAIRSAVLSAVKRISLERERQ